MSIHFRMSRCRRVKLSFAAVLLALASGCTTESDRQQNAVPPPATETVSVTTPESPAATPTATELSTSPAIDLPSFAGKSPSEVAAILGQPDSSETIRHHGAPLTKRYYRGGDIDIVYVSGKADWITIFGHGQLPFSPAVLATLGLPSAEPSFFNPRGVIRWETLPGVRELSVFSSGGGHAHYVYVLVNTIP